MNRHKAELWLSMALDGELSARRRAKLDAWLAKHPELDDLQDEWRTIGEQTRAQIPRAPQTPEAAWQDVQRAIRLQSTGAPSRHAPIQGRFKWAGAIAAAFLVLAGAWLLLRSPDPIAIDTIAAADRTKVEWLETDLPDAMSMVYEDADTGLTVIWVSIQDNGEEDEHAG